MKRVFPIVILLSGGLLLQACHETNGSSIGMPHPVGAPPPLDFSAADEIVLANSYAETAVAAAKDACRAANRSVVDNAGARKNANDAAIAANRATAAAVNARKAAVAARAKNPTADARDAVETAVAAAKRARDCAKAGRGGVTVTDGDKVLVEFEGGD